MSSSQKITPKEWKDYVEQQMYHRGFTAHEKEAARLAFDSNLHDAEYGEKSTFFHQVRPGISEDELKATMSALKDHHSTLSKGSKFHLHPEKIDELEEILHEALISNKEHLF